MNYNFKSETNECTSRGACSIAPNIAALQEIVIYYMEQVAYYIINLKQLGLCNENIKHNFITDIASLVSINEFSEKQLINLLNRVYSLYSSAIKIYNSTCSINNIVPKTLNNIVNFNPEKPISRVISKGEKLFLIRFKKLSSTGKNYILIMRALIKSVSIQLTKLLEFGEFDDEAYLELLNSLSIMKSNEINSSQLQKNIELLAKTDNHLQLKISEILLEKFEGITKQTVSHSTTKGKAILVSGNNFMDLLTILKITKDKDIDVYTHSNLLICHALNKFRSFPNLKGHYGDTTENCILDFATFPGGILLTKNSRNNTEYLYRGRLFSNDYFVPDGVIKIENNDYTSLIESTMSAKGFANGKEKPSTEIGYIQDEINEIFENIINNLKKETIKRLYIIGMNPYSQIQKEYFSDFFENLTDDEFAINFSSLKTKQDNVFNINIGNYTPLCVNLLSEFFKKYPITDNKIIFFFARCDSMTLSNLIFLAQNNAKNIYMAECLPTQINPSIFTTLKNEYKIKITQNASEDLKNIRNSYIE